MKLVRVDDPSALLDVCLAWLLAFAAVGLLVATWCVPSLRGARLPAMVPLAVAWGRLWRHPLARASLHRVVVDGEGVRAARFFGRLRAVDVDAVVHRSRAPWPCALRLRDGRALSFVARPDGLPTFLALSLDDGARYSGAFDARDSLTSLELSVRDRARGV